MIMSAMSWCIALDLLPNNRGTKSRLIPHLHCADSMKPQSPPGWYDCPKNTEWRESESRKCTGFTQSSFCIILFLYSDTQRHTAKMGKFLMWTVMITSLTLLFTSFSLGRISRPKPSAWPLTLLPPFMWFPRARTSATTLLTSQLSSKTFQAQSGKIKLK